MITAFGRPDFRRKFAAARLTTVWGKRGRRMTEIYCPQCRQHQPSVHRYCFRCGESLPFNPTAAPKRTRFFAGIKIAPDDPEGGFLRVSCYLREQRFEAPEGSVTIPGHHVRFSFWVDSSAKCVLSIPETEARELARFITEELHDLNHRAPLA
jgi:hypothetical protein